MNLSDYQVESRVTKIYPEETGLAYECMGLAGEGAELAEKILHAIEDLYSSEKTQDLEAGVIGEIGGCLWYIARLCDRLEVDMSALFLIAVEKTEMTNTLRENLQYVVFSLSQKASSICNIAKKIIRDDSNEIKSDKRERIVEHLISCLFYADAIAGHYLYSIDMIAEKNLNQLLSRKERGKLKGSGDDR